MEDRKLPWWRRALNIALDGIRSGFGLFSKSAKEEESAEEETVAIRDAAPAAANLPLSGSGAAADADAGAAIADEAIAGPETLAEPIAELEIERTVEAVSGPVEEVNEESAAGAFGSTDETVISAKEPADEPEATPDEESAILEAEKGHDAEEPSSGLDAEQTELTDGLQADEELEAELEPAQEAAEAVHEEEPAVVLEQEPLVAKEEGASEVDVTAVEEPGLPAAEPEAPIEAEVEEAGVAEDVVEEVQAPAIEDEAQEAFMPNELTSEDAVVEIAVEKEMTESVPERELENEPVPVAEVEAGAEAVAEAVVEPATVAVIEPAVEADIEPVVEVGQDAIEDSVSVEADSSVELSEPVPVEVAKVTGRQPEAVGSESQEEEPEVLDLIPQDEELDEVEETAELQEPPEFEGAAELEEMPELIDPDELEEAAELDEPAELEAAAEPAAEEVIEHVAEEIPEPVDIPMELNEPIPEQPTEAAEPDEAVPAAEAVAEAVAEAEPAKAAETSEQAAAFAEAAAALADEAGPTAAATAAAPSKPFIKLESRDNESDLSPFSVVVSQVYDGPLDLLLDLIRKQDIDIYDIPIARITAQFLAYVNQLKATDVDVAGEFIYTASLLIHIKSKMLLPRAPSGGDDAAEDPRRELVERLLEHERFKNAAQMLQQKQMLEAATWTNPGMREFQDDTAAEPEIAADTVDLVRIFREILERARNRPVINVEEDSVTVGQMIQFLSRRLTMEDKPVALRRLLSQTRSERALIAMFLALLELVRLQAILLRQDKLFSEIFIKKHTGFESVMNEGAASVHDDWR